MLARGPNRCVRTAMLLVSAERCWGRKGGRGAPQEGFQAAKTRQGARMGLFPGTAGPPRWAVPSCWGCLVTVGARSVPCPGSGALPVSPPAGSALCWGPRRSWKIQLMENSVHSCGQPMSGRKNPFLLLWVYMVPCFPWERGCDLCLARCYPDKSCSDVSC